MDIEQLIRDYLAEVLHMSLGTSKDNKPWVCEVHFVFDDDLNLYFRSLSSRRHSQEIAANPNVAGNIVKQHPLEVPGVGVYFEGTAKRLETDAERRVAFSYFKGRLQKGEEILDEANNPAGHQFYKVTVANWYLFGKFEPEGAKKYQLVWNGGTKTKPHL